MPTTEEPPAETKRSLWEWISLALGVLGLLSGGVFYWLSLSSVEPTYQVSPVDTVARKESQHLAVTWDGKPIERLCLCRVALWNAGKLPLRSTDLPAADPLRIETSKPVRFLSAETTNASRSSLSLGLRVEPSAVYVGINGSDALEKDDGAVVRLMWDGDCSANVIVKGRVIGTDRILQKKTRSESTPQTTTWQMILYGCFGLVTTQTLDRFLTARIPSETKRMIVTFVMTGFLLLFVILYNNSNRLPTWTHF